MFRNYLLSAFRNAVRQKLYTFINLAGLAIGLACAIFIGLFVWDELSYDKWVPDTDGLYRLELTILVPNHPPVNSATVPYPIPAVMRDEIPGVTGQTRLHAEYMTMVAGDRQFSEKVDVVDPGFFTLIKLPFVMGNPESVIRQPQSVVLTQSTARKYFGDANPIGRFLSTVKSNCADGDTTCQRTMIALTVTGVIRDLPHNTQLAGDIFIPNTSIADPKTEEQKRSWFFENGWGYVRLAPGVDPASVVARMDPIFDREVTPLLKKFGLQLAGSKLYRLHMTSFSQVHLASSTWQFNQMPPGSWTTVYGIAAIGVLILLVACFNFTNLSTARASLRAREIALRKTMGARRWQVIVQFLSEAVIMALLALVLAFSAVEMLLPAFDSFLQLPVGFHSAADWQLVLALIGVAVVVGLVSGIYPALVLSGFRPAATLHAAGSGQTGPASFRSMLIVLQFAVSIGLGIAVGVVFAQINYARNIDLGFHHDNIVIIGSGRLNYEQREAFARALRANAGIAEVGRASFAPFQSGQDMSTARVPGQSEEVTLNCIEIDPDFPKVYGIQLIAGRLLSEQRSDDRFHSSMVAPDPGNAGRNILINAAAARRLGFGPEEAVGKTIVFTLNHVRIVGVLADVKSQGAREPVKPTVYAYVPTDSLGFSVRLRPDAVPETLAFIDRTWRSFSPNVTIGRYFLDSSIDDLYAADEKQGTMFGIFVGIAIFIACLGLFGLAAFTAERRTREIGIRKVMGARTQDIVRLLLWQFSVPVLVANVIAWPVAWYYLRHWLDGYAYRIELNPLYFVAAGAVALVIAWLTVVGHALRVARANPVHALRYE